MEYLTSPPVDVVNKMIVSVRVAGLVTAELSLLISEGLTANRSLSLYIIMVTNEMESWVTLAWSVSVNQLQIFV